MWHFAYTKGKQASFFVGLQRKEVMMMWKPSSKQRKINNKVGVSMENHKLDKLKDQPHLSGAYIRTLVKHLTSIKSKDSFNGDHRKRPPESVNSNGRCFSDSNNMQQESPPPPQPPHKKQVRRRRHTTKPYQERLLNMAEARREIVTALKFHRASMKLRETAGNHRQPEQASSTTTADLSSSYLDHKSLSSSPSVPRYCHWPISTAIPPPLPAPLNHENLDFTLPDRTLGLNLNFQYFKDLEANLYHNPLSNYPTSSSTSSSFSSSSSSAAISLASEEVIAGKPEEVVAASTTSSSSSSSGAIINGGLHHAVDDEGMEEIRSLGEQHQMEWNDTVNLLTSAQWFKFLNTIEIEQDDRKFDDDFNRFDQPCMDMGEIEGMDEEWLV